MDLLEKAYNSTSGMTLDEIAEQQLFEEGIQECIQMGEHFKRILPENGYDVCFNCGGKE